MSIKGEPIDHELVVRTELREIKEQAIVTNMILREAFGLEINSSDIEDDE